MGLLNTDLGEALVGFTGKIIDKIWPDKIAQEAERTKAKLALLEMQQSGDFRNLEISMGAILAEANSADPWTSRARPSFLYVIYFMILMSVPMGVVSAFYPAHADAIIIGMGKWLNSIPEALYGLFGVGYLGYAGVRTWEKKNGLVK